jgi:excisionase family DNA binding protein
MSTNQTYTINEAAALTGLHRNTIRQRIKLGQLDATVQQGKFGEEYRITHAALVKAGLVSPSGPLGEDTPAETVLHAEFTFDTPSPDAREASGSETDRRDAGAENGAVSNTTLAALGELFQRHEQAMFRLGYLQVELERLKALEETAESLRQEGATKDQEVEALKTELVEKERQAQEVEALRRELEQARERLREMEALRQDIEQLKAVAHQQEQEILAMSAQKRPWWRFWEG